LRSGEVEKWEVRSQRTEDRRQKGEDESIRHWLRKV